ncbi:MAG: amidohydrolase family protein [Candidatus Thorarchaeota archaeon]
MSEKRLILHKVAYFDAVNGKFEDSKSIVIKNFSIDWVGDESTFEKEENDQIIDLEGKYVLPGLIDCHVHLDLRDYGVENPYQNYLTTSPYFASYKALKSAQEHIRSGFTTVRDCASENWGQSLNRAISSGLFRGPRVLAAQLPIMQMGTTKYDLPYDQNLALDWQNSQIPMGIVYPAGVDQMIQAVRERIMKGSDFIKVLNSGAVFSSVFGSKFEKTFFREDEMTALVDEAHRNGLHVACHSHPDQGINEALDAGVDTIEHASLISEDTSKRMAKTDSYLIPTFLVESVRNNPERLKESPGIVEKLNSIAKVKYDNHRIAFEAGVKFALGSDSGPVDAPHGSSAKELSLMVENIGMSQVQALQCATIHAAEAIKLKEQIGSIEVGKTADLIVVGSNPIDNLSTLEDLVNIEIVIKSGSIVAKKGLIFI